MSPERVTHARLAGRRNLLYTKAHILILVPARPVPQKGKKKKEQKQWGQVYCNTKCCEKGFNDSASSRNILMKGSATTDHPL